MLRLFLFVFAACLFFSACNDDDDKNCDRFEWGYEGEEGPDAWPTCYDDCDDSSQSPVNIEGATIDAGLTPLELRYEEVLIDLLHKGHTIEFEYEPGSTLILNGLSFSLLQFHFHTESEHTIAGTHYPLEVHLVHRHEATGQLAVIGMFFEEGNTNPFLQSFAGNVPQTKDAFFRSSTEHVNVHDLIPADGAYYTYSGSLTTPPCSEIVTWFVMKTPVTASSSQIQEYRDILQENNRPVQSLQGREIREYQ